jgi:hypothetical protein
LLHTHTHMNQIQTTDTTINFLSNFTFAYTIFRWVNQLYVKVMVISVRTHLYNLRVFLLYH